VIQLAKLLQSIIIQYFVKHFSGWCLSVLVIAARLLKPDRCKNLVQADTERVVRENRVGRLSSEFWTSSLQAEKVRSDLVYEPDQGSFSLWLYTKNNRTRQKLMLDIPVCFVIGCQ